MWELLGGVSDREELSGGYLELCLTCEELVGVTWSSSLKNDI